MPFLEKMNSWIPPHFKENQYEPYVEAMAELLDMLDGLLNEAVNQTFISESEPEFLTIHGRERRMQRVVYGPAENQETETEEAFQNRVRRIKYNRTAENISDNILSVVSVIGSRVVNDYDASFLEGDADKRSATVNIDGEEYGNYGPLDLKRRWNCFSVLIDTPIRPPLAFYNKEAFYDNRAFYDQRERVFNEGVANVVKTLIKQKSAAGKGFRLLIKGFKGLDVGTEAQQEADLNRL